MTARGRSPILAKTAAALLLALGACVPTDRYLRSPIVDIEGDILGRYWVVRQPESVLSIPEPPRDDCGDGYVVVRYVVDSLGKVFEREVVHAEPVDCYEEAALRLVETWSYSPAPQNERREPVRVTQRIPFTNE